MSGWRRIPVPGLLLAQAPTMRAWQREVRDGHLSVFAGPEPDGFHLSISHRTAGTPAPATSGRSGSSTRASATAAGQGNPA